VEAEPHEERRLTVLTRVRCLECGFAYAKPANGRSTEANPGCPRCGYVGWIPAGVDVIPSKDVQPTRSVADLRQHRGGRRR
jgi:hypothetical protein